LAAVRATLQKLLDKGDDEGIKEACTMMIAEEYIKDWESPVMS